MLLKALKKNWLAVLASAYSLIVALFWLALRINWSGISKALGADKNQSFFVMQTPLIFCILMWLVFAFSFFSMIFWKRKLPSIISLSLSGVFTVIIIVVIALGANDYLSFVMPKFWRSLAVSVAVILFGLLLFFPPVTNGKLAVILKASALACAVLLAVFSGVNTTVNKFSYGAVVYAVEDDYQIVFSTTGNSTAWVKVGDETYYDLYAGSMRDDLVHKVSVPQEKLDQAKGYTICAEQMIYRGPFGGYKGKVISKDYRFRPVDSSDGLVYYSISDVHGAKKGAVRAAAGVEKLDFLVTLGDNISMIDSEYDAQFVNSIAHEITGGEIPVIYARGNHEVKGLYAEDLYKYVGTKGNSFYYWFKLSDVFGVTLDLGEDHEDEWWEYYGTAKFTEYHQEQTAMLQQVVDSNMYQGSNYKMVVCHIPIPFINSRGNHKEVKNAWTDILNVMQPDIVLAGHQHDLYPFLEGKVTTNDDGRLVYNTKLGASSELYGAKGGVTNFQFNTFLVGRRGTTQKDSVGSANKRDYIGLVTEVNYTSKSQTSYYINSKYSKTHQKVSVLLPFFESDAQTDFVTPLKTIV